MSVDFQKANVEHCEILLELMREYYALDGLPFDKTAARRVLGQILQNDSFGQVWLIKEEEKTAGYAVLALGFSLEFLGRDAFIDEIYLRSDFREKGFGKQTLRFLEEQCRKLGVRALHLEVERENKAAHAVYQKNGFADHDRFLMTKWIEQKEVK